MVIHRITELSFSIIIKADSDYAYSRNRNETLEKLNRLRLLAQLHGTPKSLLSRLDKNQPQRRFYNVFLTLSGIGKTLNQYTHLK